jgi:hypothetical protein
VIPLASKQYSGKVAKLKYCNVIWFPYFCDMTDFPLLSKISSLPDNLKKEVEAFVDLLITKNNLSSAPKKGIVLGLRTGTVTIKDNFDEPIEGFDEYT